MLSRRFASPLCVTGLSQFQCRLLAATPLLLGVSPYLLFVKEASKRPELKGLPVAERGKMMGRWYKELSQAELDKLKNQAANTVAPARKQREPKDKDQRKKRTTISSYGVFISRNANRPEFNGLPVSERGKRMAAMYKALSPAEVEKLKTEAAAESKKRAAAAAKGETAQPKKQVAKPAPVAAKPKPTPTPTPQPAATSSSSKDDEMEI
jgi:hypothetical protein